MFLRSAFRCRTPFRLVYGSSVSRHFSNVAAAKKLWGNRLVFSEEVEAALHARAPIVALESTIITHGMPHPVNLETAQSAESIIRASSAVPATIAIIDGKIHVGLSSRQLEEIADVKSGLGKGSVKVSRRDLAPTLALKRTGGTTVAGTMYVASSVGIHVFVTGGIGGVHRGAENSMDISADLIELGRTPMAVVCAGAKSILDIPRTLEVLETQGVCVATYGGDSEFPAFYHPSSGCESPWSVPDIKSAASLVHASLSLPTPLSTLLAVPIPSEHADAGLAVQRAVEQAVRESVEQGIDKRGKEVTPWLLKRVGELTKGTALGLIAVQVSKLFREQNDASSALYVPVSSSESFAKPVLKNESPKLAIPNASTQASVPFPSTIVFGSAAIDLTSTSTQSLVPRTTTPGQVFVSPGGVGRNIAEAAQNLLPSNSVQLVSAYGSVSRTPESNTAEPDAFGKLLLFELAGAHMRTDGLVGKEGRNTAVCSLTLEKDGDLVAGVADMGIVETLTEEFVARKIEEEKPEMVVFDLNLLEGVVQAILTTCQTINISTFCDPTSTPKLPRLIPALNALLPSSPSSPRPLTHLTPNLLELDLLHSLLSSSASDSTLSTAWEFINSLGLDADWRAKVERFTSANGREWIKIDGVVQKMVSCLPYVASFWVKAGQRGLLHLRMTSVPPQPSTDTLVHPLIAEHNGKYLAFTHYTPPIIRPEEIISTTGAGDTLAGGLVAGLVGGKSEPEEVWVRRALDRVGRSLRSKRAVG
ncbi:indigoidine synthase A family protein [Cryptococcus deuterogattii 99/473]|uniref:Indigoidine synthase A family protein n=1 Tax=Cryptococcus deuterogattii Ram5 TaxID=1296110 RepID=A0A0D0TWE1_9TREE|nr:indigoidine synthase A family protein [Cryptococcus deuterogattii Ram5]KIR71542.1 indigoidine synthase A family protein [Cryptococcus deuterogattii CA1014]KIR96414.1 indigoidine synthase A family protein [Cryptococcus deuterogattii 2001/935-1]KIY55812.1 indigoidine synthase A family protein [Cryptococcus deuterogattii 99/473]